MDTNRLFRKLRRTFLLSLDLFPLLSNSRKILLTLLRLFLLSLDLFLRIDNPLLCILHIKRSFLLSLDLFRNPRPRDGGGGKTSFYYLLICSGREELLKGPSVILSLSNFLLSLDLFTFVTIGFFVVN